MTAISAETNSELGRGDVEDHIDIIYKYLTDKKKKNVLIITRHRKVFRSEILPRLYVLVVTIIIIDNRRAHNFHFVHSNLITNIIIHRFHNLMTTYFIGTFCIYNFVTNKPILILYDL